MRGWMGPPVRTIERGDRACTVAKVGTHLQGTRKRERVSLRLIRCGKALARIGLGASVTTGLV